MYRNLFLLSLLICNTNFAGESPATSLSGTVLEADGTPGHELDVYYSPCDGMMIKGLAAKSITSKEGKFVIERFNPEMKYDIEIFETLTQIPRLSLKSYKPDPENFKITLPDTIKNKVKITDMDGTPIQNAQAQVFYLEFEKREIHLRGTVVEFLSDSSGYATLRFWNNSRHIYRFGKESFLWTYRTFPPESFQKELEIKLEKACIVKGKLVASQGNLDFSRATVYFHDGYNNNPYGKILSEDGTFFFNQIPPGEIAFTAIIKGNSYIWKKEIKKDMINEIVLEIDKAIK